MKKLITFADGLAAAAADYLASSMDIHAAAKYHALTDALAAYQRAKESAKPAQSKGEKEPSGLGWRFAEWCAKEGGLINLRVTQLSLRKWALCYDALVEKDGHSAKHISEVWAFAREHSFYSKVVLSPLKLRENDKGGVRWFDRLAMDMARTKPKGAPVQRIKGREL